MCLWFEGQFVCPRVFFETRRDATVSRHSLAASKAAAETVINQQSLLSVSERSNLRLERDFSNSEDLMNRRILGGAVFIIALATVTIAIGRKVQLSANAFSAAAPETVSSQETQGAQPRNKPADNDSSAQAQADEVPEHVVYGMLFREVNEFRKKAKEKENRGDNASDLRNFHRNKTGLDERQSTALEKIAADCQSEVDVLDRKARKIILDARALHPGGLLAKGETLPPPPAELKTLDEQRVRTILKARDFLRASLGEGEFLRFDKLSKKEASEKLRPAQFARPTTRVPGEGFAKRPHPAKAK